LNKKLFLNLIAFQISWFSCVIGAGMQYPWLGAIIVLTFTVWHLRGSKNAQAEILLLSIVMMIGGLFDQVLQSASLIHYQSHGWSDALVPAWILALWLAFACTLNVSLRWMRGKWLLSIIFGLIGGPLAYIGAEKLGAATLTTMPTSYIALAVGWSILMPLLLFISRKFDGFAT
jgi:hypothetical protein